MIEAARALSASGAGDSFLRFSIALSTIPFGSPSFAGRSNSTVSTPAFTRWAAIWAPMTPAPSTAALRMRREVDGIGTPGERRAEGRGLRLRAEDRELEL